MSLLHISLSCSKPDKALLLCGLTSHLLHECVCSEITISEHFACFSEGLFEVVSQFFLQYNQYITYWRTVSFPLNRRVSVISERVIAGLLLMPSNSPICASRSLKIEINLIFTNSSTGLVLRFSVWRSQERTSSLINVRNSSSAPPKHCAADRNVAVITLSYWEL